MKLEGVRVVDLSQFLPGPHLTMMMADHGAEVVKVEPPAGEPVRNIGYRQGGESVWFRNTHRGKKSVVLDLKTDAGRAGLYTLADNADVLVEAFRPGVMQRLGFDYDTLARRNPRLIYVSIAAFGQSGPAVARPAHDIGMEALGGVLSLNLGQDGKPTHPAIPMADCTGSLFALAGVLMALYRRETTGRGDYIDISMHDCVMAWLPNNVGTVFADGRPPVVRDERSWGGHSFYNIYATQDGRWVVLAGVEHKFIHNLLRDLGREDLIPIATQPPGPAHAPVKAFLAETIVAKARDEWEAWFKGRDVCFAPVLDLDEAFRHPQVWHREMVVRDGDGNLHIGNPIKFRNEPPRLDTRVPRLGEHNPELLE
jgi:crotonobetainyl-CoA:carnitine CoA-transferase CaiB-like acyl-CoA transferase